MSQSSLLNHLMASKLVQTGMLAIGLLISNLSFGAGCADAEVVNSTGTEGCNCCNIQTQGSDNNINTMKPINVLSGNKFRQEEDIKPQDVSQTIGLEYNRYYNSQSNYANVLGYGWRSSYDIQLLDTNDSIQIIQNDGSQLFFYPTTKTLANGLKQTVYMASNKKYGYITKNNNTGYPTWQWQYPSRQQLSFSSDTRYLKANTTLGKLERIVSNSFQPNSDYLALRYDNQQRLIQVQDSQARQLTISYTTTQYNLPLITVQSPQGQYRYYLDKQGNLSQYVNANGDRTTYYYQDPYDTHNLTKKVLYPALNPQQPQLLGQWQYDKNDRAIYESLADGKQAIRMQYDNNAPLNKAASLNENGSKVYTNVLTNALGQQTRYQFNIIHGNYRTLSVQGAGCQSCGTTKLPTKLDEHGNLIEKVIGDNTYYYTYDDLSRLTRIDIKTKEGAKQWLQSRTYQGENYAPTTISQPSVITGKQVTTQISYNQYQQPTQVIQQGYIPATATSSEQLVERQLVYHYGMVNGNSKLISIDGVLPGSADTTSYQYNTQGQLVQINHPEGLTQRFGYDEAGRISHFQEVDGVTTEYQYDNQGQVIQTIQAGKVSKINYDAQGRLQQLIDPLGQTLNYQYNNAGELSQVSDGKLAQINLARDIEGNLTQADLVVNGKLEQQKKFDVMNASDKQSLLGMLGQISNATTQNMARPDLANNPFSLIQSLLSVMPLPVETAHTDTDIDQKITTYLVDDFGNTVQVTSPTTDITTYQYNAANQIIASHNVLGQQHYQRDNAGRIVDISIIESGQQAKHHQIIWGKTNKPIKLIYPEGEETFNYTPDNQLLSHTQTIDGKTFTISYQYDDKSRLQSRTLPDGQVIYYQYNADTSKKVGLLNGINLKGIYNRTIISGLNSDTDTSLIEHFKFGNGVDNTLQKDLKGRIVLAGNPQVGQTILDYDNPDITEPNRVQQKAMMTIGNTVVDKGMTGEAKRIIDSILYHQGKAPIVQPQQDIIQNLSQLPQKDTWGRTIQQGTQHYEYDSQNRLTTISVATQTGNQVIAQYRYNTLNQRIAKTTYSLQGVKLKTTYFFYDGNHLVAESSDEAGQKASQLKQYIWLNDKPIAVLLDKELFFIHTDHRNAPIAVTDSISRVVWQATNEDFGYAKVNAKSKFELNLRLSNQYYDSESGLHNNTNRYYDALNARYLSADALGLAVGPDLFAFGLNQPHSVSDSDGLAPTPNTKFTGSAAQKLEEIFKYAMTAKDDKGKLLLAENIRMELKALLDPASLAVTGAIFVGFSMLQVTPFGWLADAAMTGLAAYYLGAAAWDMLKAIIKIGGLLIKSCTYGELWDAGKTLSKALATAVSYGIQFAGAKASFRLSEIFKTLPEKLKLPKFEDAITKKIDELKLSKAALPTRARKLSEIINQKYAVVGISKLNRQAASYYLNLKNTMHVYLNTVLEGPVVTIFDPKIKPRFTFHESPDGKLDVFYVTPTNGAEKPNWPTNLKPYLLSELENYKKTGYFDGFKPDAKFRPYLEKYYYKINGCKGRTPGLVILIAASINAANCDVSFNVAQVAENGDHPAVKVSNYDTTGGHDKSFDDTVIIRPRLLNFRLPFKNFNGKNQCFVYSSKSANLTGKARTDYENEYYRQVSRQNIALNQMTAAQYVAAREAYKKNGRNPDAAKAQRDYRIKYENDMIANLTDQYVGQGLSRGDAIKQARIDASDAMKKIAALHEPDMFAGGYFDCKPTCMGDKSINSIIGTQWKKIIGEMDAYADTAIKEGKGNGLLSIQLNICK